MPSADSRARYLSVSLSHIRLVRGSRVVLRGIKWRIQPDQRWLLLGANGAGKTQLLKLIAGDVWPTPSTRGQRRYHWHGQDYLDPYGVKQEIAYLGAERQDRYERYQWNFRVEAVVGSGLHRTDIPLDVLSAANQRAVRRILARLDILELRRRKFLTLSYGERRLVLLARALAWRPRLLLLDELCNGLDALNRERALKFLDRLRSSRLPWVFATHRLEDVPSSVTHLCRLERGRIIERRRQRRRRTAVRRQTARPAPRPAGEPLLVLRNAYVWLEGVAVLRRLSLQIRRGECWVLTGANGSGKSTLLRTLYGDLGVARGGSIWRLGTEPGVPLSEFKRHVAYIAPELQAQLPRAPRPLSYGQQRRSLFRRAFTRAPDILLLDEPYAGLDARTRQALQARVERAVQRGATVVIATHHRDEWPAHATHALALVRGRARIRVLRR